MKIIINILALCIFTSVANAQAPKSNLQANTKIMTTAEANKLNGVAQPTINGKPYSQYKAEQETLKANQQSQTNAVAPASGLTMVKNASTPTAVTTSPAVISAPPAEKQPVSLQVTPVIGKPDSNTEKPKEQPVQTEKPKGN